MRAAAEGHEKTVQALIDKSADVNAWDSKGQTALIIASIKGHEKTVQTLINSHAEVNAQDLEGQTALMFAYLYNHQDIIKILDDSTADMSSWSYIVWKNPLPVVVQTRSDNSTWLVESYPFLSRHCQHNGTELSW